jgi:hypothetical protein
MAGVAPAASVAAAYLGVNEVQELADQIGELKKLAIAAGADLRIRVQVELDGGQPLRTETIAEFNAALQCISKQLRINEAVSSRIGN